ncbi:phospholipase D family protein [Lederbergia wuyishanensis]|uniref:HKD family nuclease n=1 Tax=Lederbergia wuyishanensis TaxID=1347903 RepID=A0ABU0D5L8_9BACI|nr:phospholipase D family protein [Lederbergia wuyishanensis]MCJ8009833.1 phospholipase D family protein [Lederbergia wuyishanensis]MDQ0343690.1 HKD family nuclease [Lederbergia wuyishanensis]
MPKRYKKGTLIACLLLFLSFYIGTIYYHENKPLPKGVSYEGDVHYLQENQVQFLYDLTYKKGTETKHEQEIFEAVFQAIKDAEKFIVLDFFLFNDYYNRGLHFPQLSSTLTKTLIEKKKSNPNIEIVLITDEINTSYGSHKNEEFEKLEEHGIKVLLTDVDPLRDSNPLYSAIWRMFFQWFGQEGKGTLPNVMADKAPDMTLRSYLKLLNVKANHRKTVATDKKALILSGNPHDASAYHSNIGFELEGPIIEDMLKSEQAAANLAGGYVLPKYKGKSEAGDIAVQLLTEGKVANKVIQSLKETKKDDQIWMAMFYLAERDVIEELLAASERGVKINLIFDPNENAFGSKKSGLPNRPVAQELNEKSKGKIQIRWYNTGQEQYHPKLLYIKKPDNVTIIGGSTNFTQRNMDDYNLETDIKIEAKTDSRLAKEMDEYFSRQWNNKDGEFTLDLEKYQNPLTTMQRIVYLVQKLLYFTTY